jgi:hypothetical protein
MKTSNNKSHRETKEIGAKCPALGINNRTQKQESRIKNQRNPFAPHPAGKTNADAALVCCGRDGTCVETVPTRGSRRLERTRTSCIKGKEWYMYRQKRILKKIEKMG